MDISSVLRLLTRRVARQRCSVGEGKCDVVAVQVLRLEHVSAQLHAGIAERWGVLPVSNSTLVERSTITSSSETSAHEPDHEKRYGNDRRPEWDRTTSLAIT